MADVSIRARFEIARGSQLSQLKTWREYGKSVVGNFCAVTLFADSLGKTGGQARWVELNGPEIALLQRVNDAPYGSPHWHYLIRETNGSLYATVGGVNEDTVGAALHWFIIAIGSGAVRNSVQPLERSVNFVRIAGIPKASDYSQYSPQSHPHLFHRVWCDYGSYIGDTPQGILYMPIFDPASGFKISLGGDGLWLASDWLV